jgi:hypothetical protein
VLRPAKLAMINDHYSSDLNDLFQICSPMKNLLAVVGVFNSFCVAAAPTTELNA